MVSTCMYVALVISESRYASASSLVWKIKHASSVILVPRVLTTAA